MANNQPPLTRAALLSAIRRWDEECDNDLIAIGNTIRALDLQCAIVAGVRPAMTFERAYALCFGLGLDGKAVRVASRRKA